MTQKSYRVSESTAQKLMDLLGFGTQRVLSGGGVSREYTQQEAAYVRVETGTFPIYAGTVLVYMASSGTWQAVSPTGGVRLVSNATGTLIAGGMYPATGYGIYTNTVGTGTSATVTSKPTYVVGFPMTIHTQDVVTTLACSGTVLTFDTKTISFYGPP
jgi:hypothetical protein